MWTAKNRGRYDRSKLRYPSDLTDDEWARVEPLIPPATPALALSLNSFHAQHGRPALALSGTLGGARCAIAAQSSIV